MPIYEYECSKCGVFELMQKITEDPIERCPRCKRKVKKLISESTFMLKGSGWYVTDYAKKGNGNGKDKKDKGVDLSGDSKESSSSKSETKKETGKDTKGKPASDSKKA